MQDNYGKAVTISYRGCLDDDWQFAEATPESPMTFPCVEGMMLPEFVEAVRFMRPGETKKIRVAPQTAFEAWTEERVITVERNALPPQQELKPGDIVHLQGKDGTEYAARLVSFDEEHAVFDANHEAVAQGLNFEITLLSVRESPFASRC